MPDAVLFFRKFVQITYESAAFTYIKEDSRLKLTIHGDFYRDICCDTLVFPHLCGYDRDLSCSLCCLLFRSQNRNYMRLAMLIKDVPATCIHVENLCNKATFKARKNSKDPQRIYGRNSLKIQDCT